MALGQFPPSFQRRYPAAEPRVQYPLAVKSARRKQRRRESFLPPPTGGFLFAFTNSIAVALDDNYVGMVHEAPYRIETVLGEGGMRQVYRATDTRLGRCGALKFCPERISKHFEREGRAIATLNHPPRTASLYSIPMRSWQWTYFGSA